VFDNFWQRLLSFPKGGAHTSRSEREYVLIRESVYKEVEGCADLVRGRFRDDVTTSETRSGSVPG
jgi:hypothetical protein